LAGENLLNLLLALAILIIGWIVARLGGYLVRRLLRSTRLVERISGVMSDEEADVADRPEVDRWAGIVVFWVIMLFVLIAFFQTLQLTSVAGPLSNLLNQLLAAAPLLFGAALILLLAWAVASLARMLVKRALSATRFEERLTDQAEIEADSTQMRDSLANGIFWLVFLLFLPAVLNTLGMQGLVEPVQGVVDTTLAAIPRIFGAGIILLVGWFIARIIRQIVTNLLAAANADQLGRRIGLETKESTLSQLVGTVAYILVLIPAVIAALNSLDIEALSAPAISMLTTVLIGVPAFFGALLVLGVAYFAGKLVASLVTTLLSGIGFNNLPQRLGFRVEMDEDQSSLSEIAGVVVLVAVMLLASAEAANMLGLTTLGVLITEFTVWGGQAIVALVIFAIGLYLANLARDLVFSAGGERAAFSANLARIGILVFVIALALQQLGVAPETVNLAFGILLGAIGVAAALAFGLGAREVAGDQVERWVGEMQPKPKSARPPKK
jgi:hypothetical protein